MSNLLNFKFGAYANLPEQRAAGTVYVTTDNHAMYIDLPESHEENATVNRLRIGDINVYQSSSDANFKPPYQEGFYYFIGDNALMRYDGAAWTQINTTADVQNDISTLTTNLNKEIARSTAKDTEHDTAISTLNTEVTNRVTTTNFDSFKESNTAAIEDAKKAGTDAAAAAATADAKAVAAQKTADSAKALAEAALPMSGTPTGKTMTGNINMGSKKITNLANLTEASADGDAANKKYVDDTATSLTTLINTAQEKANKGVEDAAAAKKAADDAQNTANTAKANAATADAKAVEAKETADQAIDDAAAALAAAKERVLTSDFNNFKEDNTNVINGVDGRVTTAQNTANEAKANAATAQTTAEKGVTDAAAALAKANEMLPLAGGTMTGAINMDSQKITNLADLTSTSANSDAANKKYVDDAKAAASAVGSAAQNTADSALAKANAALPKAGGIMSGAINMGSKKITNLADPTDTTDAANKNYVDSAISSAISANDAMTFVGVLGTEKGQIASLPTSANVGDTYKVGKKGTYGTIEAKVGDLIINGAENDSDTPVWIHVSSGYEDDYLQKLVVDGSTVHLTDGVTNTGTTGSVSGLKFENSTSSNIEFTVSAGTGDKPVHAVTATMVWGTF